MAYSEKSNYMATDGLLFAGEVVLSHYIRTRTLFGCVLRGRIWSANRLSICASRDRYESQVGQSPVGSIHSGCWARRSWLICCLSSAYGSFL